MIPERVCGYLVRSSPEHAGGAYLKLAGIDPRRSIGFGLARQALRYARCDEVTARERSSELAEPERVLERVDLEREEREAERLAMLREVAVALAAAPAGLREDWERLLAAARRLEELPAGARFRLPAGLTKSRAWSVRRQVRARLGLSDG